MLKLGLIFVLSLVILAGVFLATLYFIPSGKSYPETYAIQIIDAGDEWILQCDIINNEERDIEYRICVTVDDKVYRDSTVVKEGKAYTYIHHVYPQQLVEGKVSFALYVEGKEEPIEHTTYYIDLE